MSFYNDKFVRTGNAVIVWDGITRPETNDSNKLVHSLKVAMAPGSPEILELEQLANMSLTASKFNGVLPPGANWPTKVIGVGEVDPAVQGYTSFSAKTYNGAPQVFDANGQVLSPMQYGAMLYPGAIVQVLIHAYDYDNKQKGVGFGIDGIMIVDATAPRLNVAGVDAAGAFGGGATAPAAPPVAPAAPPVAPAAPPVAPAAPPVAPAAPAAVQPGVVAARDFLTPQAPAGVQLTAKAIAEGQTYESLLAGNWTPELMRTHGYIV
jgi:hypothetical protein